MNPTPTPALPPQHQDIILYTRPGCSYCAAARDTLAEQGVTFREIDISTNAALQTQYNVCAPVVVVDGRVRFRGRVNVPLLRKLLRLPHPVPQRPKLL